MVFLDIKGKFFRHYVNFQYSTYSKRIVLAIIILGNTITFIHFDTIRGFELPNVFDCRRTSGSMFVNLSF